MLFRLSRGDFSRVAGIEVTEDQRAFSGTVREAFDLHEDGVELHAIRQGDAEIGFFKIDRHYATRHDHAKAGDLGLRGFLIDRRRQGQGLATAAVRAFRSYLPVHYPSFKAVCLTVNCANPGAIRCYLKGGFRDTGKIHLGGRAGPQHVMRMSLASA